MSSHAHKMDYSNTEPTRGVSRGQGYSDKNRKAFPRGSFPESGIALLLRCLLKILTQKQVRIMWD